MDPEKMWKIFGAVWLYLADNTTTFLGTVRVFCTPHPLALGMHQMHCQTLVYSHYITRERRPMQIRLGHTGGMLLRCMTLADSGFHPPHRGVLPLGKGARKCPIGQSGYKGHGVCFHRGRTVPKEHTTDVCPRNTQPNVPKDVSKTASHLAYNIPGNNTPVLQKCPCLVHTKRPHRRC